MAGKVLRIVIFGVLAVLSHCMTTTRRPAEYEQFSFVYDPHVHILSVAERYHGNKQCYLLQLTQSEQTLVHTHDGMTRLQLKMITHLNIATKTAMTADQLASQSKILSHNCAHSTAIYSLSI